VLQRVFVEVWRSQRRYDPGQSLTAWVLGLPVPRSLAAGYDTVAVTDEIDNGDPAPSKVGVMSGQYRR
jgi:hypothetical protein